MVSPQLHEALFSTKHITKSPFDKKSLKKKTPVSHTLPVQRNPLYCGIRKVSKLQTCKAHWNTLNKPIMSLSQSMHSRKTILFVLPPWCFHFPISNDFMCVNFKLLRVFLIFKMHTNTIELGKRRSIWLTINSGPQDSEAQLTCKWNTIYSVAIFLLLLKNYTVCPANSNYSSYFLLHGHLNNNTRVLHF